jgi:hypothetical protein
MSDARRIFAGWLAAYGRSNISPALIAGSITPRQKSSIPTRVPAVSNARFAGPRSTHGPAFMISSIGRPLTRARVLLSGKRSNGQAFRTRRAAMNQGSVSSVAIEPAKKREPFFRSRRNCGRGGANCRLRTIPAPSKVWSWRPAFSCTQCPCPWIRDRGINQKGPLSNPAPQPPLTLGTKWEHCSLYVLEIGRRAC